MTQLLHIFLTKDEIIKWRRLQKDWLSQCQDKWPQLELLGLNCPDWDYNIPTHWDKYNRAKENLLEALGEIGRKPLNWPEFQHTVQREGETTDVFWFHLLEVGIALAHLDASNLKDQQILALHSLARRPMHPRPRPQNCVKLVQSRNIRAMKDS